MEAYVFHRLNRLWMGILYYLPLISQNMHDTEQLPSDHDLCVKSILLNYRSLGISLVAQWLRICLAMQGT